MVIKEDWIKENQAVIKELYYWFVKSFSKPLEDKYNVKIKWSSDSTYTDFCNLLYETSELV